MQTLAATVESRAAQSAACKPVSKWIINPLADITTLHAGAGLLVVPLALMGWFAIDSWYPFVMTVYSLALGFPHLAATHVRLNADSDCRKQFAWLSWQAPIALMSVVALLLFTLHALPYLVFAWFLLQTWHANRQNFGIMRRYIRMAGSDPDAFVNKTAGALIEFFPWATVLYACMWQDAVYQGYPIYIPAADLLQPLCMPLWWSAAALFMLYLVFEIRECASGHFVPGRFLCCLSGCVVNLLGWIVADDMSWGYLVVSLWHSMQYVAYVQAFRSRPPQGSTPIKFSALKHLGLLFLAGAAFSLLFRGINYYAPAIFAVVHLSLNFHHYLSDTLIWRRPKPQLSLP